MGVSRLVVASLLTLVWVVQVDCDIYVKDLTTNHTVRHFSDMQASFGGDFPTDGLEGWLVYASPDPEACSAVQGPPVNETEHKTMRTYILLIARGGNCQFSDKVLNAQNHHYAAAIVYNYVHNDDTISMGGGDNGSLVKIPSTFVGYTDGMDLWHFNYTLQRFTIRILEKDDQISFPQFLWPFLLAMAICILLALGFLLVKLLRDHASKKMNRLSRKHLKKIPVRKFKKGDYYDTCAICLEEYEEGEKIRVLPCDHVYHMKCIDPWLTKNKKTCPVCKRRVIPGRDADSESDSEGETRQASTGGSENTPLLSGSSGPSHGSIGNAGQLFSPFESVGQTHSHGDGSSLDGSNMPPDPDTEHGAVGGEGISDRNQKHQTPLTVAPSGRGNIQEPEERKDSHSERKRKRRDYTRIIDDVEAVGPEARAEHRERRKLRKDKKKKAENRHRRQDGVETAQENMQHKNESEGNRNLDADVNSAMLDVAQEDDVQAKTGSEGGHVNPGYAEIHEVVVPTSSGKCDINDVI